MIWYSKGWLRKYTLERSLCLVEVWAFSFRGGSTDLHHYLPLSEQIILLVFKWGRVATTVIV